MLNKSKIYFLIYLYLVVVIFGLSSCADDNNQGEDNALEVDEVNYLPSAVEYPENNPYSVAKAELGRLLFWDPVLSGDRDVACATCHHPDHGYADGIERSLGIGAEGLALDRIGGTLIDRNSPTVINTAYNGIDEDNVYSPSEAPMFWDNRAESLETQAIQPILSDVEMRGENYTEDEIIDEIVSRLKEIPEYVELFEEAFGSSEINEMRIGAAIATFERGIVSNHSRFDQYMRGDEDAMTNFELEGLEEFLEAGCAACHSGPMFSDFKLHTLGVPNNGVNDRGANGVYDFRTPTLRNVTLTGPYMHNGRFEELEDVVRFYEGISDGRGNAINNNINVNDIADEARDLNFGRGDVDEIVAFLRTLTDEDFDKTIPGSVPSNLSVGGNIN